jgi:lipooligosaccharide transport system permease protein
MTPVSADEVALAEISWATSKAMISVLAVAAVTSVLGLTKPMALGLPILYLSVFCWGMAAFAVWIATISKSYDWFIYFQSGLITPMSLFCGTYFPLEQLPKPLFVLVQALPLTHALVPTRFFLVGELDPSAFLSIGYLILFGVIFTNLACARLTRKLVV